MPVFKTVSRADRFFKNMYARKVTTDTVNKFIASLRAEGYSPASINRSCAAVQRMFRLAQCARKVHQIPHFGKRPERNTRTGFFSVDDYRALLGVLPDYFKAPFAVGFWTGVRIGEICSLRWSQIDFFENKIHLREGETKNGEPRVVPMPGELRQIPLAHRSACPAGFDEFVCYRIGRKGATRLRAVPAKMWKKCCARVSLEGKLFHDSRHSAVRNPTRAGVTQKVAMDISGHKTASVLSRYNITDARDLADATRKLES